MHQVTTNSSENGGKQTYAMEVLLEEVQALRRRVKELEDDTSAGGRSGLSVETTDATGEAEVIHLRKELARVENEKATQELDFMNQLSSFARENQDTVDELRSKLFKTEEELAAVKANKPVVVDGNDEKVIEEIKADFRDEIRKLEEDLDEAQEELDVTRKDNDSMHAKIQSLENHRNQLLDEMHDLRLEVENEAKVLANLNDEMHEMERNYSAKVERMEIEIAEKDEAITRHSEEIAEMNDAVIRMEEKKGMLLDEVTDLRMILDREEKSRNDMQRRLDDLKVQKSTSEEEGDVRASELEERAKRAEQRIHQLEADVDLKQKELRSIATSYKTDVARLEESISMKHSMLEDVRKDYKELVVDAEKKDSALEKLSNEKKEIEGKLEDALKKVNEREREVTTLSTQRESYEKRSTECIMEHVAEVDEIREKNNALVKEQALLLKQLEEQKHVCKSLKTEITSLRTKKSGVRAGPPMSPPASRKSSPASSPGRTSVRALAACFEGKGAPPTVPFTDAPQFNTIDSDLEERLAAEIEKNEALEAKLHAQSELVGELRGEIASLAATRSAIQALSRKEYERQTDLDQEEIRKLRDQLRATRSDLHAERKKVEELKKEIIGLTSQRISLEEKMTQSYDERNAKNQKYREAEINRLKVLLTEEQLKNDRLQNEYDSKVKQLEDTIEELNIECDKELDEKQNEIDILQQRLDEHVDDVRRLEAEREQLCVTMNTMSGARRDELDELQSELMEKTAAFMDLSRQYQSLEMQVEHHREKTEELNKLRARVKELEADSSLRGSGVHLQRMEVEELKHENQRLKEQVRNVTLERRSLQEKLNTVVTEKSSGRSLQVLRDRNEKLKREVERLNKKIEKMQGSITRIAI